MKKCICQKNKPIAVWAKEIIRDILKIDFLNIIFIFSLFNTRVKTIKRKSKDNTAKEPAKITNNRVFDIFIIEATCFIFSAVFQVKKKEISSEKTNDIFFVIKSDCLKLNNNFL